MAYLGALTKTLKRGLLLSRIDVTRAICSSVWRPARIEDVLPPLESFSRRHIGPNESEVADMLETCGVNVRKCNSSVKGANTALFDVVNIHQICYV